MPALPPARLAASMASANSARATTAAASRATAATAKAASSPASRRRLATPSAVPLHTSRRVLVVGGGTAGQTVSHQLARTGILGRGDIAVLDPSPTHAYQPGWTLVGGGLLDKRRTLRPMHDVVAGQGVGGSAVEWMQHGVREFQPQLDRVVLNDGTHVGYEHLVVCPGLDIKWGSVQGLSEALQDGANVSSIYSYDTCDKLFPQVEKLRSGQAIFTQPAGVIKCAGAPQKVMWMALDHWKSEGVYAAAAGAEASPVRIAFISGMPTMFSVPKYSKALDELRRERGVEGLFGHNLVEVRSGSRAVFERTSDKARVERRFDLLHVTPPMGAHDFVRRSPLAEAATGFVEVDAATLRHVRFGNVWSLGDASSLPTSKTAAAISAEAPVLVRNLAAALEGREASSRYDGYTSCPLITEYGKVMLAEFKYGLEPAESFSPWTGVDQAKPQRAFYHLKKDFFPWVYFNSMVRGTWQGPKGFLLGNPKGPTTASTRGMSTSALRGAAPRRASFVSRPSSLPSPPPPPPRQASRSAFFSSYAPLHRNRPARRPRDPLDSAPDAERHALREGATLIARQPPTLPSPLSVVGSPDESPILGAAAAAAAGTASPSPSPSSSSGPTHAESHAHALPPALPPRSRHLRWPQSRSRKSRRKSHGQAKPTTTATPTRSGGGGSTRRLTPSQIDEMRALRLADPAVHTANSLARRFGCSTLFVSMAAPADAARVAASRREEEARREWEGLRRKVVRAEREERRRAW